MLDVCGQAVRAIIEVFIALRRHDRRATFVDCLQNLSTYPLVASVVRNQLAIEIMEPQPYVRIGRLCREEIRWTDQYEMLEGTRERLRLGIDTISDRTALHEDDRVMAVLTRDGG